jgi:hypothetical protein
VRVLAAILFIAAGAAADDSVDPFVSFGSLDRAFVVLDEPAEFIEQWSQPGPNEDLDVLDAALGEIFPDGLDRSERGILRILSWTAQRIRLQSSAEHAGSGVIRQGYSNCYGMARAFVALCQRAGWPARINSLHNFELMPSHNMAEVHYAGAWHAFDPTYAVFFYTRPEYDGEGEVPSMRALLATAARGAHGFQTARELWTGAPDGDAEPRPIPEDARYGEYPFTLRIFYETLFARGFPAALSDAAAVSFPLDLDLRETDELWIGQGDGDISDQLPRRADGTAIRHAGTPVIGKTPIPTAYQTVTFLVSEPGRYQLTYHLVPGGHHARMAAIELKSVIVERIEADEKTWSLICRIQDTQGLLLVHNRYYAAFIDAIHVRRMDGR